MEKHAMIKIFAATKMVVVILKQVSNGFTDSNCVLFQVQLLIAKVQLRTVTPRSTAMTLLPNIYHLIM
jgi:hypothetical protein